MGRTMEPGSPDAAAEGGQKHTERLIISHMVLENFKSYAGVQRVGPFHKVHRKALTLLELGTGSLGMRTMTWPYSDDFRARPSHCAAC